MSKFELVTHKYIGLKITILTAIDEIIEDYSFIKKQNHTFGMYYKVERKMFNEKQNEIKNFIKEHTFDDYDNIQYIIKCFVKLIHSRKCFEADYLQQPIPKYCKENEKRLYDFLSDKSNIEKNKYKLEIANAHNLEGADLMNCIEIKQIY